MMMMTKATELPIPGDIAHCGMDKADAAGRALARPHSYPLPSSGPYRRALDEFCPVCNAPPGKRCVFTNMGKVRYPLAAVDGNTPESEGMLKFSAVRVDPDTPVDIPPWMRRVKVRHQPDGSKTIKADAP